MENVQVLSPNTDQAVKGYINMYNVRLIALSSNISNWTLGNHIHQTARKCPIFSSLIPTLCWVQSSSMLFCSGTAQPQTVHLTVTHACSTHPWQDAPSGNIATTVCSPSKGCNSWEGTPLLREHVLAWNLFLG